ATLLVAAFHLGDRAFIDGTFRFFALIGPVLPVGRIDLNLPTGFGIHPHLPAKSAGKHKCVNRFAVQDAEPQIAVLRDIFERVDRLPHRAFLVLDLKPSFDLPQLRPKVFQGH
ncbi:MAG: hypothetical protein WCD56_02805, partial [Pseudolabrys sp.]